MLFLPELLTSSTLTDSNSTSSTLPSRQARWGVRSAANSQSWQEEVGGERKRKGSFKRHAENYTPECPFHYMWILSTHFWPFLPCSPLKEIMELRVDGQNHWGLSFATVSSGGPRTSGEILGYPGLSLVEWKNWGPTHRTLTEGQGVGIRRGRENTGFMDSETSCWRTDWGQERRWEHSTAERRWKGYGPSPAAFLTPALTFRQVARFLTLDGSTYSSSDST